MTKSRNINQPKVRPTDQQVAVICNLYPFLLAADIAFLIDLPRHQVNRIAARNGVGKGSDFKESDYKFRSHALTEAGKKFRFAKGQEPPNKGKKIGNYPGMIAKQFTKGARPHNALPVGTIQPDFHGVMRIKVSEPRGWVYLHRARWEAAHGPIPRSHVVAFKNGNVAEWQLDNLELIHRSELAKRNTIHRYPPEMKQVFRLMGKLKKVINEKQNRRSA